MLGLREPTYSIPSGPSATELGRVPASPGSRVGWLSVSVAGSNTSRQTPALLDDWSGTYTKFLTGSKAGWPGAMPAVLGVGQQVLVLSVCGPPAGPSSRHRP